MPSHRDSILPFKTIEEKKREQYQKLVKEKTIPSPDQQHSSHKRKLRASKSNATLSHPPLSIHYPASMED